MTACLNADRAGFDEVSSSLFNTVKILRKPSHKIDAFYDAARALLQRELLQRGLAGAERTLQEQLVGWVEAY